MDENMNNDIFDEELSNIITLDDETGNPVEFEFLDLIEYEGEEYVVLLPVDEENSEVVILKVIPVDDEMEEYVGVTDEELLQTLFDIFKEKFSEQFDFQD